MNDKLNALSKHVQATKDKLDSPVPAKHAAHPEQYKAFLRREIAAGEAKIDAAKLDGGTKK